MKWLIWSSEHNGWWGANRAGYYSSRRSAGRYEYGEALAIVEGANKYLTGDLPAESMCPDWERTP